MIEEMRKVAVEKILWAVKAQRWYFIENNPKILIDKDNWMVWANLEYFPYAEEIFWNGLKMYSCEEAKNLMNEINSQNWGGYNSWKVPHFKILEDIIKDNFPFASGSRYIKNHNTWYAMKWNDDKIVFVSKNLSYDDDQGISTNDYVCVIPYCYPLNIPKNDYSLSIDPSYNYYSELEKLQFTLDVFTHNNLIPIFNDLNVQSKCNK